MRELDFAECEQIQGGAPQLLVAVAVGAGVFALQYVATAILDYVRATISESSRQSGTVTAGEIHLITETLATNCSEWNLTQTPGPNGSTVKVEASGCVKETTPADPIEPALPDY
jgi:hypothetical protein